MNVHRCECGEMRFYASGIATPMCAKCELCGTTFGGGEPKPHDWRVLYNQNTGKPYSECRACGEKLKDDRHTYAELNAEVERLGAGLEFYANERNWQPQGGKPYWSAKTYIDGGAIAREAIGDKEL